MFTSLPDEGDLPECLIQLFMIMHGSCLMLQFPTHRRIYKSHMEKDRGHSWRCRCLAASVNCYRSEHPNSWTFEKGISSKGRREGEHSQLTYLFGLESRNFGSFDRTNIPFKDPQYLKQRPTLAFALPVLIVSTYCSPTLSKEMT